MPDGAVAASSDLTSEILAGLSRPQKTLPAKLFYDEEGCRLFNLITGLDEYYLTRAEVGLLRAVAAEIAAAAPADTLVEYGASDESKAEILMGEQACRTYIPIDIAPSALDALQARLSRSRPGLSVAPLVADFSQPLKLPSAFASSRICGFFPGSTIGNFEPDMVVTFLRRAIRTLAGHGGARLIVGTDLRKSPERLIPAYDDAAGVTAAFNKNMLSHVNRVADADFDLHSFRHRAAWNDGASRIEMHLVSTRSQIVHVGHERIAFAEGETIHTESSYKHTSAGFLALAAQAGWRGDRLWTDPEQLFGIHLLGAG